MIGKSEKETSITFGSRVKSFGRSVAALSTASFTFCFAKGTSTLVLNSTMITDTSCKEVELSFFTPEIDFNCFSIGFVTRFSILTGELPT